MNPDPDWKRTQIACARHSIPKVHTRTARDWLRGADVTAAGIRRRLEKRQRRGERIRLEAPTGDSTQPQDRGLLQIHSYPRRVDKTLVRVVAFHLVWTSRPPDHGYKSREDHSPTAHRGPTAWPDGVGFIDLIHALTCFWRLHVNTCVLRTWSLKDAADAPSSPAHVDVLVSMQATWGISHGAQWVFSDSVVPNLV